MRLAAILAGEGHEPGAEDIERGHAGGQDAEPEDPGMVMIRTRENLVLAEESGSSGYARDRDTGKEERPGRYRNLLAQASHVAQILFAAQSVDHASGSEEEQRFEKGVRHQVEDASREHAGAHADEHIAELRNRRVGENFLDVELREADGGGHECRRNPDNGYRSEERRVGKE